MLSDTIIHRIIWQIQDFFQIWLHKSVSYTHLGRLDYVFVSHGDMDHINGLEELLERQQEGCLLYTSYQIFTVLNYALENFSERKLRRGYLAPLHFFYVYCIDRGISDLTQLEQNQIDEYFSKAKEVPLVNNRYPQIVDKVQRILFLQAKDINWDANVWYLERCV